MNYACRPWFASQASRLQDFEPGLVITSSAVIGFDFYYGDRRRSLLPKHNKHSGVISRKQAGRIKNTMNLLIDSAKWKTVYERETKKYFKFKVNLITLTLPTLQVHPDKEIHEKCFKTFIRELKTLCPGLLYLYKAEVQDNGNLHYHVTTNSFIHRKTLRELWNKHINNLGYVDRYKHFDPNSTDVHSCKSVKNLPAYMVKYLSKKDIYTKVLRRYHSKFKAQLKHWNEPSFNLPKNYFNHIKRHVELKLWDASKILLKGKCSFVVSDADLYEEIEHLSNTKLDFILKPHCFIIPLPAAERKQIPVIDFYYRNFLQSLRDHAKAQPAQYVI